MARQPIPPPPTKFRRSSSGQPKGAAVAPPAVPPPATKFGRLPGDSAQTSPFGCTVIQRATLTAETKEIKEAPMAGSTAGVVRRTQAAAIKIGEFSKKITSKIQEVQIMNVGGKYYFSSNSTPSTNKIDEGLRAETKETKVVVSNIPTMVGGDHHAEQNLLLDYARQLKNAGDDPRKLDKLGPILPVYGRKPPCNICRMVMNSFSIALVSEYRIRLEFNRFVGDTDVKTKDAKILTDEQMKFAQSDSRLPAKYLSFLEKYKAALATEMARK